MIKAGRKVKAQAAEAVVKPKKRRASITSKTDENYFKVPEAPQTPKKRLKTPSAVTPSAPPPVTPPPSAVGLISSSNPNPRRTAAKTRKAAPNATNAPLQTPGGSRIVAYPSDLFEAPSSQTTSEPATTTENLLEKACAHMIEMDPKLKVVIEKHHCKLFSPEGLQEEVEPFTALASGIMAQQVCYAAGNTV